MRKSKGLGHHYHIRHKSGPIVHPLFCIRREVRNKHCQGTLDENNKYPHAFPMGNVLHTALGIALYLVFLAASHDPQMFVLMDENVKLAGILPIISTIGPCETNSFPKVSRISSSPLQQRYICFTNILMNGCVSLPLRQ